MEYQVTSSGLKTADTAICATGCRLHAIQIIPDGSNVASAVVYDNASAASGLVVAKGLTTATSSHEIIFNNPVICNSGIYVDVTGTGAGYIVHYSIGV